MASATIDSLELQLQSNAGQAVTGIDSLVAALNRLKTATTGGISGLNTISDQLLNLSSALSVMTGDSSKINKIAESIDKLSSVGESSGLKGFANDIKDVGTALYELKDGNDSLGEVAESAEDLGNTSADLNKVADSIDSIDKEVKELNTSNKKLVKSVVDIQAALKMTNSFAKALFNSLGEFVNRSNDYIENMNLFQVTMGEYAEAAQEYAEKVGEIMGIDPGEWMRNQGVFNTIIKGFGVASDKATLMSKNLTQLGYDLSSFYNISVNDAMQKIGSGIAGELEPLRRLGYDLSVARLQQEALNLGIEKSVNAMTQAEKSQLRYYAILTQVTDAQGDMARTLSAPANQLRILSAQVQLCARSIGNLFIPVLNAVIPYIIAFVRVLRELVEWIARFFGISYSSKSDVFAGIGASMGGAAEAADDISKGTGGAAKNIGKAAEKAKKLKSYLLGIDELNIISPDDDDPLSDLANSLGGGSGGSGIGDIGGGGGDLGIDLPEYDFLQGLEDRISAITDKIRALLPIIGMLALAIAGLKLAKLLGHLFGIDNLLKTLGLGGFLQVWAGSILIIAGALGLLWSAIDAIVNGVKWRNVLGIMGSTLALAGGAFLVLRKLKPEWAVAGAGLMLIVGGITALLIALNDMSKNGMNAENLVLSLAGTIGTAVGAFMMLKNVGGKFAPMVAPLAAFVGFIQILSKSIADIVLNGLNTANAWGVILSGLGAVTAAVYLWNAACAVNPILAIAMIAGGIIMGIAGIAGAIRDAGQAAYESTDDFQIMENVINRSQEAAQRAADGLQSMKDKVSSLGEINMDFSLAEQLAKEIFDINENANATTYELEQMRVKVDVLNGLNIQGLSLSIDETTGRVKESREQVQGLIEDLKAEAQMEAMKDVLVESYKNEMQSAKDLATAKRDLTMVTGELEKAQEEYASYNWWEQTFNSEATALKARIDKLEEAKEASASAAEALEEEHKVASDNIEYYSNKIMEIRNLKPDIQAPDFSEYQTDMSNRIKETASIVQEDSKEIGNGIEIGTAESMANADFSSFEIPGEEFCEINGIESPSKKFKEYGKFLIEGLALGIEGDDSANSAMINLATIINTSFETALSKDKWMQSARTIVQAFATGVNTSSGVSRTAITTWAQNIKRWFTESGYGGINADTWNKFARQIVSGFNSGIRDSSPSSLGAMQSWGSSLINAFTNPGGVSLSSQFSNAAYDVVNGFNNGLDNYWYTSLDHISTWARNAISRFRYEMDINSPSKVFRAFGEGTVEGYNQGIENEMPTTVKTMSKWAKSFIGIAPTVSVDSTALEYASKSAMAQTMSGEVVGTYHHTVSDDGFADGMEEFYREYLAPTLADIASDTKRQADKSEQTTVYVGNRVVTDAVTTQRKANGYSFSGG